MGSNVDVKGYQISRCKREHVDGVSTSREGCGSSVGWMLDGVVMCELIGPTYLASIIVHAVKTNMTSMKIKDGNGYETQTRAHVVHEGRIPPTFWCVLYRGDKLNNAKMLFVVHRGILPN